MIAAAVFAASFLAALVLAPIGVSHTAAAVRHVRHERCLARIAALEVDLGYRPAPLNAPPELYYRTSTNHRAQWEAAHRWHDAAQRKAANYTTRPVNTTADQKEANRAEGVRVARLHYRPAGKRKGER